LVAAVTHLLVAWHQRKPVSANHGMKVIDRIAAPASLPKWLIECYWEVMNANSAN
jgi:hypothetical protein